MRQDERVGRIKAHRAAAVSAIAEHQVHALPAPCLTPISPLPIAVTAAAAAAAASCQRRGSDHLRQMLCHYT